MKANGPELLDYRQHIGNSSRSLGTDQQSQGPHHVQSLALCIFTSVPVIENKKGIGYFESQQDDFRLASMDTRRVCYQMN